VRILSLYLCLSFANHLPDEGLVETRTATKRALYRMSQIMSDREHDLFDRTASRVLTTALLQRVRTPL
jgi:hypothetical protein